MQQPVTFISYDWVMLSPVEGLDAFYSRITSKRIKRVPCIRLFGHMRETGESTCLIIHDYYPHLLVRKPTLVEPLLAALDPNDSPATLFDASVHSRHDIYGYASQPVELVKLQVVSPLDVARVASAIQDKFPASRLYNVHIPYLLQFLIDHDLQGLSAVSFTNARILEQRQTFCQVELHVHVKAIVTHAIPSQTVRDYPIPKPLVMSQQGLSSIGAAASGLVCGSALDPVWEEEAERCRELAVPFPYEPEGIESGIGRPSVEELDFVRERNPELKRLAESANFANTQDLLERLDEIHNSQFVEGSEGEDDGKPPDPLSEHEDELLEPTILLSTQRPSERSLPTTVNVSGAASPFNLRQESCVGLTTACFDRNSTPVEFLDPCRSQMLIFPPPPKLAGCFQATGQSRPRWSLTGETPRLTEVVGPALAADNEVTYNTLLAIELVMSRAEGVLNLNPETDGLRGFVAVRRDQRISQERTEFFCIWGFKEKLVGAAHVDKVHLFDSEHDLLVALNHCFREFDPCVVLMWDCSKTVTYLYHRATFASVCDFNLSRLASFDPNDPSAMFASGGNEAVLPGRISLGLWRLLRSHESGLNLGTTSFEGCVQEILGLTVPSVPMSTLADWLVDDQDSNRIRAISVVVKRAKLLLEMLDASMLLDRAIEMSRIYGCDVPSVISRGSQFRVECMLTRACRRSGFALVSSSKQQVKSQMAPEGIPLVLEPKSGFYTDPVCVLDFQSLYPSIMIAYNICYSTCLGKLSDRKYVSLGTQGPFERDLREALASPGGVVTTPGDIMFVGRDTRVGILPRMLHEVIQTRFMVKRAMKKTQSKPLARKLDARQLTLKLLANVTYGYTSASFSGRMPCGEVADAIVLTGRRTLERAMATAETMGGEVIYGDTDSLFVRFKGASLQEAFERGYTLADAVTKANPWPMKLQMEKVYWPCCMITKKRYVGRAFETPSTPPRFDAKGIETVRRDNCPLTAKSLRYILEALFANPTVSHPEIALHAVVKKVIGRIYREDGTRNIRDFIFQNQVRTDYKDPEHLPPAARVAANLEMNVSSGQRVAYVVARRGPEALLADQVVPPSDVTCGRSMIDIDYYVNRQILPALQRTLGIQLSASLTRWIKELPKRRIANTTANYALALRRCRCLVCGGKATKPPSAPVFCEACLNDPAQCIAVASGNLNRAEVRLHALRNICISCAGDADKAIACTDAYHCSAYFDRERENRLWTDAKEDFIHGLSSVDLDW